ncbi:MAG: hypothetical protein M0C28_23240 [Candidatus Moduliflexus flocculans]|nr:hypothetical protein [Candidatus Moduliflexus flocculans]
MSNVHAIGDKGTALMLDTYERLMKDLGRDLDGLPGDPRAGHPAAGLPPVQGARASSPR